MDNGGAIFMALPSYNGKVEFETAGAFLNWSTRKLQGRLHFGNENGSLLALCFNGLLCKALDTPAVEYFCMLHADVIPQDGWLDTLWQEFHRVNADVLSVVIPMKDLRGLTSTAIDDKRDPFNVLRRITTTEAKRLPPTFSAADCGYPKSALLVNTGCWLARLDVLRRWADEYAGCFTIRDRIVRRPDGKHVAQVASEDWNFSRDLHRLGARVFATRAVRVKHVGRFEWDSGDEWGQEYDEVYGEKFGHQPIGGSDNGRSGKADDSGACAGKLVCV